MRAGSPQSGTLQTVSALGQLPEHLLSSVEKACAPVLPPGPHGPAPATRRNSPSGRQYEMKVL